MNKFIKKITKGIIFSMILIFILNLAAFQINNKTDNDSQAIINNYLIIPSVYAEDGIDDLLGNATGENAVAANAASNDILGTPSSTEKEEEKPKSSAERWEEFKKTVQTGSLYIHRLFSPLINFFSFKIGHFIGNDHIYSGAMGTMLKKIWVVSRNLVNIIFVLILLFLALKEIFWVKEEGGTDLKKSLLTFVLLLVAVNFSWLVTKVVLDAANIATNIVFAIPMGIDSAGDKVELKPCEVLTCGAQIDKDGDPYVVECNEGQMKKLIGNCSPDTVHVALGDGVEDPKTQNLIKSECEGIGERYSGKADSAFDEDGNINSEYEIGKDGVDHQNTTTFCWETLEFAKYDQNTSVIYLTYGMARIQNVATMAGTNSVANLSIAILFSLVLQVAYTVALMALFIALIIRMAVLWLFVAFSPFMVLMLFGDVLGGLADKAKGTADFNGFLKWAFVPVKVGAVFTVSFLMISAGQSLGATDASTINTLSGGGVDMSYKIYNTGTLFAGIGGINQFIWYLITVGVLWMGVFAVLGDMPIVKNITDKISQYGKDTAGFIAKSPYWAPIMPMIDPQTGKFKLGSYAKEYSGLDLRSVLEDAKRKATQHDDNLQNKSYDLSKNKEAKAEIEKATENSSSAGFEIFASKLNSSVTELKNLNKKEFEKILRGSKLNSNTQKFLTKEHGGKGTTQDPAPTSPAPAPSGSTAGGSAPVAPAPVKPVSANKPVDSASPKK